MNEQTFFEQLKDFLEDYERAIEDKKTFAAGWSKEKRRAEELIKEVERLESAHACARGEIEENEVEIDRLNEEVAELRNEIEMLDIKLSQKTKLAEFSDKRSWEFDEINAELREKNFKLRGEIDKLKAEAAAMPDCGLCQKNQPDQPVKPCPFCGETPDLEIDNGVPFVWHDANGCVILGDKPPEVYPLYDWNRRAS